MSEVEERAKRKAQAHNACTKLTREIATFIPHSPPDEVWNSVDKADKKYMECMREWIAHGGNEKLQNFKNAHEALLDKWREHEDVWA
jgi:hypothetical protein